MSNKREPGNIRFAREFLIILSLILFLVGSVFGADEVNDTNDVFSRENILKIMKKVNAWQCKHPWKESDRDWIRSTYYTGVMALHKATGDQEVLDQAMRWARKHKWQEGTSDDAPANRVTCGQVYLELYFLNRDVSMIKNIHSFVDSGRAYSVPGRKLWYYCDALYVAPPVLAMLGKATGDKRYVEQMNEMYWDVVEHLYDKESNLFYRDERFLKIAGKKGEKIFWSRGNGWVIAGIPRILEYLPTENPYYDRYLGLLQEIAGSIAKLQGADGLWRANLTEPDKYPEPETSGSAFFCYAIAWSINQGLLDRERYLTVVVSTWKGLVRSVNTDGKLGWVQQVADRPGPVRREDSHEYATGAFLLAGKEVLKLTSPNKTKSPGPENW